MIYKISGKQHKSKISHLDVNNTEITDSWYCQCISPDLL